MKRLPWKDEDLEHERKSSQRIKTELSHEVCIHDLYTLYTSVHNITVYILPKISPLRK